MRWKAEQKREIERALLEVHDALVEIKEKTGFPVSVGVYGDDKETACVFIHTKTGIASIYERSEIEGFFNSDGWRNRRKKKAN